MSSPRSPPTSARVWICGSTSEQVAYVAERKLAPLGLIAPRDGTPPSLERLNALLALRFRAGVVGERPVNALAALLACDVLAWDLARDQRRGELEVMRRQVLEAIGELHRAGVRIGRSSTG